MTDLEEKFNRPPSVGIEYKISNKVSELFDTILKTSRQLCHVLREDGMFSMNIWVLYMT